MCIFIRERIRCADRSQGATVATQDQRQQRKIDEMEHPYVFTIHHHKGTENSNADSLSRMEDGLRLEKKERV